MIEVKNIIKYQKQINKNRIARASVIAGSIGKMSEEEICQAVDAGYKKLNSMTKEKIIKKYIDTIDALMIGIFEEKK